MLQNYYNNKDREFLSIVCLRDAIEDLETISVYNNDKYADELASMKLLLTQVENK